MSLLIEEKEIDSLPITINPEVLGALLFFAELECQSRTCSAILNRG
jgi:hypothetical protein